MRPDGHGTLRPSIVCCVVRHAVLVGTRGELLLGHKLLRRAPHRIIQNDSSELLVRLNGVVIAKIIPSKIGADVDLISIKEHHGETAWDTQYV